MTDTTGSANALVEKDEWSIEPRTEGAGARLREVWAYRRLLRFFATRAIERRYQRTVLGRAWLFIQPLFPLLVKTLVFGGLLGVGSQGVPYFIFLVGGTAAWELFQSSLMWATRSLEMNRGLVSKVFVPRIILPIAMMSPAFVTFLIHLGVIAVAVAFYYARDGVVYLARPWDAGWAILAVIMTLLLSLAIGLFTAPVAARARDVRFTLNYILDFWVFLTPVLYPLSAVPPNLRWVVMLNPMAAFVEAFKFGVLGIGAVDLRAFAIASAITFTVLGLGLWYFGKAESDAVDRV